MVQLRNAGASFARPACLRQEGGRLVLMSGEGKLQARSLRRRSGQDQA